MTWTNPEAAPASPPWVVRAPGRVNLIGEHTDYNAGLCLPVAIPAETRATASRSATDRSRITSRQQPGAWVGRPTDAAPGRVRGWAAYAAGVLWALTEAGFDLPPLDLRVDSTVPLGAGLSSSASLEAAVAVAATAAMGLPLDETLRHELVTACRRAETEVVGAPTGGLDQTAVLLARAGHALLLDFGDGTSRHIALDPAGADLALLVVDTRVAHAHAHGGYAERRAQCEAAAASLGLPSLRDATPGLLASLGDDVLTRRARHVVGENHRVTDCVRALETGDWAQVGALLDASHRSLRDDFEVSCRELDLVVDTARTAGALGARMTGGGFGGAAIVLVPDDLVDGCRRAIDLAFHREDLQAPGHLAATPSAGAGAA